MSELVHPPFLWMIGGLALCAAEIFAPGAFLLWIGLAAILLGALLFVAPLSFEWSLLLFAVLAVFSSLIGRRVYGGLSTSEETTLNSRAAALVGREFTLIEPIVAGEGKARVQDTVWRVCGADAPAGARVRVTGAKGAVLTVEPA